MGKGLFGTILRSWFPTSSGPPLSCVPFKPSMRRQLGIQELWARNSGKCGRALCPQLPPASHHLPSFIESLNLIFHGAERQLWVKS